MNKPVYWTTATGEKIDIDKMSVQHLRNALKLVVRALNKAQKAEPKFELKGDMAQEFNDSQESDFDWTYNEEHSF